MNLIVVGCGRLGAELAGRLSRRGHEVTVIDAVAAAFDNLPADFRGRTVEGEVLNQDVLHRAGIEHADGLAAVTNSDAVNAVVAHVATVVYRVPHVVVRNYNPRWRPLHEAFNLQVVSSTTWGAQRLEELLCLPQLHPVWSAGDGLIALYECSIPEAWQGHTLRKVLPEGVCQVLALVRAGRTMPRPLDLALAKGDVVYLSATPQGHEALRRWLDVPPRN
jgi:trk system potassium uptake protein TrkA